jgi:lysophospholipase L1-like esterase
MLFPCRRQDRLQNNIIRVRLDARQRVNAEIAAWCAEEKITFLNLNVVLSPSGMLDPAISTDGIHLNSTGYLKWSAVLYPVLRQTLALRTADH